MLYKENEVSEPRNDTKRSRLCAHDCSDSGSRKLQKVDSSPMSLQEFLSLNTIKLQPQHPEDRTTLLRYPSDSGRVSLSQPAQEGKQP